MADKMIQELPLVPSLLGHELIPVSTGGSSAESATIDDVGTYLEDRFNYGCRLKKTSDQTISSTSTWTALTWDTDSATGCWDTGGWWSTGSTITVPTGLSGQYIIAINLLLNTTAAGINMTRFTIASSEQIRQTRETGKAYTDFWLSAYGFFDATAANTATVDIWQNISATYSVKSGSSVAIAMVGRD